MVQPLNICCLCYTVLFSWREISTLGHVQVHWYLWLNVTQSSGVSMMAFWLQYGQHNTDTFQEYQFFQAVDENCYSQWLKKNKTGSIVACISGSGLQAQGLCQQDLGTKLPHSCSTGMQHLTPHRCIVVAWGIVSVPQCGQQMSSFNENNNLIFLSNNILEDVLVFSQDLIFLISTKMSWAKLFNYRLFWEESFIYNLSFRCEDYKYFL